MKPRPHENLAARLLADLRIVARALPDPRVPWYVKALLFLIACYVFSPIDLIPDFIPVLGLLDEAILVPLAIRAAVSLIPETLRQELRREGEGEPQTSRAAIIAGFMFVIVIWTGLILLVAGAVSD